MLTTEKGRVCWDSIFVGFGLLSSPVPSRDDGPSEVGVLSTGTGDLRRTTLPLRHDQIQ